MVDNPEQRISELERAYALQKRAREEAEHLLEEKSRELFHKNVSLRDALEQLKQQQAKLVTQEKLASVGQLGASLAHELNNPNAFVQNNLITMGEYIEQLAQGLEEAIVTAGSTSTTSEERQTRLLDIKKDSELDFIRLDLPKLMEETLQGTKRIASIANGLRYFANPDLSTRKPTDVNECIKQAQALVHHQKQLPCINYELSELVKVQGLPLLLSQALANIIQNAIEAKKDRPHVLIRSYQDSGFIYIDIEDKGLGIEQGELSKIFMPFYSTKESHNGLGLIIAQQIIDQHEGHIEVKSKVKQGTLVTIALPLKAQDTDGQDATS